MNLACVLAMVICVRDVLPFSAVGDVLKTATAAAATPTEGVEMTHAPSAPLVTQFFAASIPSCTPLSITLYLSVLPSLDAVSSFNQNIPPPLPSRSGQGT